MAKKDNKGKVLTKSKEGEVGRYDDDHPATELAEYIEEQGGEVTVRSMGFKMTDKDGGRLGFCTPKKEGYAVYLTTIPHDSEIFEEFDLEVSKGSSGLAVIKDLGAPAKAVKTLRALYKAKAEAEPEPEEKPKKAKKDKAEKPKKDKGKKKKAKESDDDEAPKTARRKKKRHKSDNDDDE